jgi:hypothetical protein
MALTTLARDARESTHRALGPFQIGASLELRPKVGDGMKG